jgi:hypothetical protein
MQSSWWQYREWVFRKDMNGDGAATASDVPLWAEWLFYWPGDALIAQFGETSFGRFLEVTPASFGSATSAALSVAGWVIVAGAVLYLPRFFIDIVDPTSRQERRERRAAQRARKREARRRKRAQDAPTGPEGRLQERREPHF